MRIRALTAAFLALSLVAACGNSDDDDTSSPATSADAPATSAGGGTTAPDDSAAPEDNGGATDVGVTADEIRVSQIVTTSGASVSGQAGFELGFEAYVEALNEAGGINGRKINIVSTRNDNGEPARQAAEFQAAVEQDDVFLVLGSWPSFGAAEYAIANGIPVIGTAYDSGWQRSNNFFGVTGGSWEAPDPDNIPSPPPNLTAGVDAYIAGKLGVDTFGAFGYTQAQSAQAAQDACNAMKTLGFNCPYVDTSLQFGFTDLGASIDRIRSSGAKHFYAAMDIAGCTTIIRSFLRAGLNDLTLRCAVGYGQETIDNFADLLENVFIVVGAAPFESDLPEMQRFITELTTRKPGTDPSTTTLNGWLAGIFLEDVLREMGPNVTRQRFIETARTAEPFKSWNARNLLGDIDWTTNRHEQYLDPNYKPDPNVCSGYLLRADVENRTWVQVGEKPTLCVRGIVDQASLQAKMAEDDSSLEVADNR